MLLSGGVWNKNCKQAAGYFGAFCAGSALYAAFIILVKIELGYELPGDDGSDVLVHVQIILSSTCY